jgi:hypothetical protein
MRYAVALSGYFDTISTGNINSGILSHEKINKLFGERKVDYYIHCWQEEKYKILKELYNPVSIICEPQKDFSKILVENNLDQEWFDENFDRNNSIFKNATIERCLSFYYSRKQAISLIKDYYDQIFIMRLDIGNVGPDEVNFPYRYDFILHNNTKKVYSVFWEQINCGLGDMWFISGFENSKIISNLYDKSLNYYKKNSDYVKCMTQGWPDSEWFDFYNISDHRQFSNLVINNRKSDNLMKYPKWYCINSHSLYKYFFMDIGLYNDTVYI